MEVPFGVLEFQEDGKLKQQMGGKYGLIAFEFWPRYGGTQTVK
jgi:hypothetical protein